MTAETSHKFKIASDRVRREREMLVNMSSTIRVKSITSDRIMAECLRVVSEVFGIEPEEIKGRSRLRNIVIARHAYCHLSSSLDPMGTLGRIGESIGRDHSTVINSIKKCNDLRETDIGYATAFHKCIELLEASTDNHFKRIRFDADHLRQRANKRQRELLQASHAVELVADFMRIWDKQILSDGFFEDGKQVVEAFNELRTKATNKGF